MMFIKKQDEKKKVMVFGVFDGLHEGHRNFLNQAKQYGDHLIVVVAPDTAVQQFKNRLPHFSLPDRINFLSKEGIADEIVEGDRVQYSWEVIKKYQPSIIALGYDQEAMRPELEAILESFPFSLEIRIMDAY